MCVVNNFKGRQPENEHIHTDNLAQMPMISIPRVESPLEKVTSVQVIQNLNSTMRLLSRANEELLWEFLHSHFWFTEISSESNVVFSKNLVPTEDIILEQCLSHGKYFFDSHAESWVPVRGICSVICRSFKIRNTVHWSHVRQHHKTVLLENICIFFKTCIPFLPCFMSMKRNLLV